MQREAKPGDPLALPLRPYRPTSGRQRLWIVVLTLVTVIGIALIMLRPQARLSAAKLARAEAARLAACPPGAASAMPGCPGSDMPVLMLPAPGDKR